MKNVRNTGRGPLRAFGHELAPGQAVEISDEQAEQLAADPHVDVTVTTVRAAGAGRARGRARRGAARTKPTPQED